MNSAIQVRGLKKSYGNHMVLGGLDFQIKKGEIFALLGVNGAGKTTALECIEGLRKYDSGAITVNGKMGIQLQSSSLPAHIRPKLTMIAQLVFLPSIMLSGIMFPIDLLPDFLEAIGRIFPASWGYRLMLDNGFCLENLWYLILLLGAAMLVCGILAFKQNCNFIWSMGF